MYTILKLSFSPSDSCKLSNSHFLISHWFYYFENNFLTLVISQALKFEMTSSSYKVFHIIHEFDYYEDVEEPEL